MNNLMADKQDSGWSPDACFPRVEAPIQKERPCCGGQPGDEHAPTCRRHRAKSGPGGIPVNTTRVRLPTQIAAGVSELVDAGHGAEVEAALTKIKNRHGL